MACLRSFISPIRTSLSSSSIRNPVSGKLGPPKSWLKNFERMSPIYAPKIELMSIMQRRTVQNLNLSGRKMFAGSFLGLSVVSGVMYNQPIVAYAMDDHYVDDEGPSGFLNDDLHTLWSLTRKFELPIVLLVTVVLGWRHPITLAINIALLLLCTMPNPITIYMFIEQLRLGICVRILAHSKRSLCEARNKKEEKEGRKKEKDHICEECQSQRLQNSMLGQS